MKISSTGIAAFLLVFAFTISSLANAQIVEVSPANRKALGISTAQIHRGAMPVGNGTFGVVIAPPGHSNPVFSPFNGILVEPLVVSGMKVKEGQPVAVLYSPEYETARTEANSLRLTVEHMEHLSNRARELRQLGLRSAQEVDEVTHDLQSAQLLLAASQGRLRTVRSTGTVGHFKLLAPSSGVVTDFSAIAGETVGPSEPFLSLFDGKGYWLHVALPEQSANSVSINTPIQIADTDSPGQVVAIDPMIDAQMQTIGIKAELPGNTPWRLGQLVEVSLEPEGSVDTLTVPTRALVRIDGAECVFVEVENGFRKVIVTVTGRNRTEAYIQGELKPEDRVAISGLAAMKNLVEGA